jgi:hypothetical protein
VSGARLLAAQRFLSLRSQEPVGRPVSVRDVSLLLNDAANNVPVNAQVFRDSALGPSGEIRASKCAQVAKDQLSRHRRRNNSAASTLAVFTASRDPALVPDFAANIGAHVIMGYESNTIAEFTAELAKTNSLLASGDRRIDEVTKAVDDLYKRLTRPGASASGEHDDGAVGERAEARALCVIKHALEQPTDTGLKEYRPSSSEIDTAVTHIKGVRQEPPCPLPRERSPAQAV